ncbi:MAG: peptidylprolyl isomerase [Bacteroidales bacterium]
MAVIGQIRKHSGLLIVIVGIALAAFVLGDFIRPSQKHQQNYIGEIAGTEIPIQEFNQKVDEQLQIRREQQQTENVSAQDVFQIKQGVWNQMVEEVIMGQQYEKVGLTVTSEELSDQILGDQPHNFVQQSFRNPNSGTFDPEMVKSFLQNLDQQSPDMRRRYLSLEQMVKEDRLQTKYKNLLTSAYHIPEAMAQLDFGNKNKSADIRFVAAKFASIADSLVTVSDSDMKAYYEEHKYNYKQDETRSIDYVIFEVKPTAEDRKEIAEMVNELYEEFGEIQEAEELETFINSVSDTRYDSTYKKKEELPARIADEIFESPAGTMVGPYVENETYHIAKLVDRQQRPDSIMMSQILISYATAPAGMDISERTYEEAEALYDSLYNVLKRNPGEYEDLAVEFSDYPSAPEDKGEIGWVIDGNSGFSNFYNHGVKLGEGEIGQMESALGLHIIKVTEKTEPVEKARIAILTRDIEPSNETYQDVYMQASRFAGENSTLAQLDTAAANQGLNVRSADRLGKMANRIAGVDYARQIIRWAFLDRTELDDVSPVFEDENRYIVAALKEIRDEGYTAFEQVKEQIRPIVTNQKKAQQLVERIEGFNSNDLYAIAAQLNEQVDTTNLDFTARNIPGFGSEYEVIGEIFTLEAGQLSQPLKGNNAVFVVMVDQFNDADPNASLASTKRQLHTSFESKMNTREYFKALEEQAEIEDNRLMFY